MIASSIHSLGVALEKWCTNEMFIGEPMFEGPESSENLLINWLIKFELNSKENVYLIPWDKNQDNTFPGEYIITSSIIWPRIHESRYFWNRIFLHESSFRASTRNQRTGYQSPIATAFFFNSTDFANSCRILTKYFRLSVFTGFLGTGPKGALNQNVDYFYTKKLICKESGIEYYDCSLLTWPDMRIQCVM